MVQRISCLCASLLTLCCAATAVLGLGGCMVGSLVGGMSQNAEYQKKIEVPAQYEGLTGQRVAVLVDVDMATMYEYPVLASQVALGVATGIQKNVPDVRVVNPESTLSWQYRNSNWSLMPLGDVAAALDVERLVIVDVYEFRLNPPGNQYEWDGVCGANVRIVEADERSFDPDTPADEFNIIARFPDDQAVLAFNTPKDRVESGLVLKFVQRAAWLFYPHIEPKYPDKYRPELDT